HVRPVLRDDGDAGHGVLDLDRGGARGARSRQAGQARGARREKHQGIAHLGLLKFDCSRRTYDGRSPIVTWPPPVTDLVTEPVTSFTRMLPRPEIEASRLSATPPSSTDPIPETEARTAPAWPSATRIRPTPETRASSGPEIWSTLTLPTPDSEASRPWRMWVAWISPAP